jgi:hypothetical protein
MRQHTGTLVQRMRLQLLGCAHEVAAVAAARSSSAFTSGFSASCSGLRPDVSVIPTFAPAARSSSTLGASFSLLAISSRTSTGARPVGASCAAQQSACCVCRHMCVYAVQRACALNDLRTRGEHGLHAVVCALHSKHPHVVEIVLDVIHTVVVAALAAVDARV